MKLIITAFLEAEIWEVLICTGCIFNDKVGEGVDTRSFFKGETLMFNKDNFKNRKKQWDKYNLWEITSQSKESDPDLTDLWNWYNTAWKMAWAQNPGWINQDIDQDKLQRIQKTRDVFSKLRGFL